MDWLQQAGGQAADWGMWALVWGLMLIGLVGTVLPVIPGHLLIFIGAVVNKWWMADQSVSWGGLVLMLLMVIMAYVIDFLSGAVGTKWFGGSKWAIIGVLLGGLAGLFFGLPGLIIGPLAGAFVFEMIFAKKRFGDATKATFGTAVGTTMGLLARLLIGGLMIGWFVVDVFYLD